MRVLVFAAGLINEPEKLELIRRPGDVVIAADGGARHCRSFGLVPNIVIGDFDSLGSDELVELEQLGVQTIRFPNQKDFTDLELALQHACRLGAGEILVFGALGLRWDQTLANLLLLASPGLNCAQVHLLDGNQEIFLIRGQSEATIRGRAGDTVSLIPIAGDAVGITTEGLEYPLADETLFFGASRGVSNVLLGHNARITLREGLLVCLAIHQAER